MGKGSYLWEYLSLILFPKKYHPIYVRNGQILKFWPITLEYLLYHYKIHLLYLLKFFWNVARKNMHIRAYGKTYDLKNIL